jgi:hypothetical protein
MGSVGCVEQQKEPRGRFGPEARRSAVQTVRACAESVRVPSFSRDLLPKTTGLTQKQFEADLDLPFI